MLFVQYTYSAPVEEYNAMVYVKRRDTFHVDSSPDLYGEVKVKFYFSQLYCINLHYSPFQVGVGIEDELTKRYYHVILPKIMYHNKDNSAIHNISQRNNLYIYICS